MAKGDKSTQDHWIFQQAATWPDIIRKQKQFDRPAWHYIDIPQYLDPSDEAALAKRLPVNIATDYPGNVPNEKYNVIQAIALCRAMLNSKAGPEIKSQAYCWLIHLVGDIHQPLHSTALFSVDHFPKGDKGGNEIKLAKGKNLHSLWDNLLGSDSKMSSVAKAVASSRIRNGSATSGSCRLGKLTQSNGRRKATTSPSHQYMTMQFSMPCASRQRARRRR